MNVFGDSEEDVSARRAADQQRRDRILSLRARIAELHGELEGTAAAASRAAAVAAEAIASLFAKWEYKLLDDVAESVLSSLGGLGWELVAATTYETGFGIGGNTSTKVHARYIFKRPIFTSYPDQVSQLVAGAETARNRDSEIATEIAELRREMEAL